MPLQRLEICVEMLKLVVEFVVVVAESVGIVIHQNDHGYRPVVTATLRGSNPAAPSVPLYAAALFAYLVLAVIRFEMERPWK
ncbi:hypothetical protein GQ457_10G021120 [Hibiscus cannabinus]